MTKTPGHINLFSVTGNINAEGIFMRKKCIWDWIEIQWDEMELFYNGEPIELPPIICPTLFYKRAVRRIISASSFQAFIMIKKDDCWFQPGKGPRPSIIYGQGIKNDDIRLRILDTSTGGETPSPPASPENIIDETESNTPKRPKVVRPKQKHVRRTLSLETLDSSP